MRASSGKQRDDAVQGRLLERHHERERAAEEQRIKRGLGHQRAGVDHRRHRESEHSHEQRERRAYDPAARRYAGTAASDMTAAPVALASPYAVGTDATRNAGAISNG